MSECASFLDPPPALKPIDCIAIIDYNAIDLDLEETTVASITIRNLDDVLKQRLRIRAAENGRSMEEEAREILREAVGNASPPRDLAAAIRNRVARLGGVDLELPKREPMRDPVRFD